MIQTANIIEQQVQVSLSGSMYVEEARILQEKLNSFIEEGHHRFLIDLSEVDYIDSTGLGALVAINKKVLRRGGSLKITGTHGLVREVFKLTCLNKVFGIV